MKLSKNQKEVLGNLKSHFSENDSAVDWARTMDCGGTDCSHHSRSLGQLVKMGLAERKRWSIGIFSSGHWRYRITDAGRTLLEHHTGETE